MKIILDVCFSLSSVIAFNYQNKMSLSTGGLEDDWSYGIISLFKGLILSLIFLPCVSYSKLSFVFVTLGRKSLIQLCKAHFWAIKKRLKKFGVHVGKCNSLEVTTKR